MLTPNDLADVDAIRLRLAVYADVSNQSPTPFQGKCDRTNLSAVLATIEARQMALASRRQHHLSSFLKRST